MSFHTISTQTASTNLSPTEFQQLTSAVGSNASFGIYTSGLALSGGNIVFANGSPFNTGVVWNFTARTNITGGMWVSMSGNLALAGPASVGAPMGVALTTTASGGVVPVILHGVVPMIAEGTIVAGAPVQAGAGAGLNTVIPSVAGSGLKFAPLDSAASGTTSTVFIKL